jgi:hypothetical protein
VYTDPGTENGVIAGMQCYLLMDQMNMPDQMLTSMLQAPAAKESSVGGHTSGNSVQVCR